LAAASTSDLFRSPVAVQYAFVILTTRAEKEMEAARRAMDAMTIFAPGDVAGVGFYLVPRQRKKKAAAVRPSREGVVVPDDGMYPLILPEDSVGDFDDAMCMRYFHRPDRNQQRPSVRRGAAAAATPL
jgi:hypothetical protein